MRIESETGIIQPQTKEPKGAAAIRSDKRGTAGILYPFPKWINPADILIWYFWLQSCKTTHFCCIKAVNFVAVCSSPREGLQGSGGAVSPLPCLYLRPPCSGLQLPHTHVVLWFCVHTCCTPAWETPTRLSSWWNCNSSLKNSDQRANSLKNPSSSPKLSRLLPPSGKLYLKLQRLLFTLNTLGQKLFQGRKPSKSDHIWTNPWKGLSLWDM